jgi:cell division protein FtsZ
MVYLIENEPGARIKVIGAGGCGGNAINHMIASGLKSIEFVSVNTDSQALRSNAASTQLQIGQTLTRGRGAGGNPEIGRKAALEDEERLRKLLAQAEMVFVTAGMGGGTGTGSAPVIARLARESGALTVGVVTKPFLFEGRKRKSQADEGVRELKDSVDTLITIPNDRLLSVASRSTTLKEAFQKADDVLLQAVRGIAELVTVHGLINLDFADVRSVMADMGIAMMGTAFASGEDRAVEAAQRAISSPLLENMSIKGARGLLINVTGAPDVSLYEVHEAASLIQEEAHEDANIIFGAVIDEKLSDEIHVTVIATGFGESRREPERRSAVYSPAEFRAAAPIADILPRHIERPMPEFSTGDAYQPPAHPQPQPNGSIAEAPASPPTEMQPIQVCSTAEAETVPSPSHNGTLNGNGRPILRHGLVDEKILDLNGMKPLKLEQSVEPTGIEQNGLEKENDHQESAPLDHLDMYSSPAIPPAYSATGEQLQNPYTAQPALTTGSRVSSGQRGFEAPAVGRRLTNFERRLAGFLDQIWRMKM